MINTKEFYETLINNDFSFFTGVPDSLLKELCLCINDSCQSNHIIAANEGNAVAIAGGYNIATSKYSVVYMQNSGIGNAVNPLLSLIDEQVYNIPMLFIIGYRGEPNIKDEPQHIKQGKLTIPLLDTLGVKFLILNEDYKNQIKKCYDYIKETNKPIALIVRKGTFSKYEKEYSTNNINSLSREESLDTIIRNIDAPDFIVSTTGKTSREIFEIREKYNKNHSHDFLTVGSMGHASSIALGISLKTENNIFCIDGDGAFIMHMGGLAIAVQNAKDNFKYILINNGCHESVGGQPTIANSIDIKKILLGFGFQKVYIVNNRNDLVLALEEQKKQGRIAIIINTNCKSRENLGRPTISPIGNKEQFQNEIRRENESFNI